MQIKQGIWANGSDNPAELKHNKICQHREYNCLNSKKFGERTNRQTNKQTYVLSCAMRN